MHIAEGYLSPVQCAVWYAASAPFVIHGARAVIKQVKQHPENRMLLATAGAFTFVLSALKLPSAPGSSTHPTGTGAGAILFKPPVMAFMGTLVLIFQALLLAHGGLTTLGANVFSMAVVGPWAGYGVYRLCQKLRLPDPVGIFLCLAIADLATYCVTAVQLGIALPDQTSGVMGGIMKFLAIFAPAQLPLAVIEGILGILLFRFLAKVATPELRDLGVLRSETLVEEPAHV